MKRKLGRAEIWRHPRAEHDLLDIWLHVARDSVAAADRLLDAIDQKCALLADHPGIGPPRPDIAAGARMLTVGRYLVLYRIAKERIEIVRVVHGSRRLEDLF